MKVSDKLRLGLNALLAQYATTVSLEAMKLSTGTSTSEFDLGAGCGSSTRPAISGQLVTCDPTKTIFNVCE